MFSKQLQAFLFGVVMLVTFGFAMPPPIPNRSYMNLFENSNVDQIPSSLFDSSFAKLSHIPKLFPNPVDPKTDLIPIPTYPTEPDLIEPIPVVPIEPISIVPIEPITSEPNER